jgi:hypothetical protein
MDTMLEYYLGIDPGKLSDEMWAQKFMQISNIRKKENSAN